nr:response regulator transcription factor [Alphaproteobacteria bacterium]
LSARSDDDDVITALNLGANDYVIRPFSADVLLARINAALRSSTIDIAGQPEISNGPLRINLVRHEVYLNETLLGFTPKEYNLLRYFIVNRGRMLTHREILQEVWGKAHGEDTQYLRVFIGQIRAKIEIHPAIPKMIITEPGVGYRMEIAEILALPQSEQQQRAGNAAPYGAADQQSLLA